MTQPSLFNDTIQQRFEAWLIQNPKFWPLFVQFARQAKQSGRKHYGVKAIIERVRWHTGIETSGDDFKVNNNWTSRLARKLEQEYPEFNGFFEKRELRTE